MKYIKYFLLIIGLLALVSVAVGFYQGQDITDQLLGIVSGISLLWGYYVLNNAEKKNRKRD